jgi:hypothetical protein
MALPVMSNFLTCDSTQRILVSVWAGADDQRLLPDAHDHVAVEEEADAAEHLLLFDAFPSARDSLKVIGGSSPFARGSQTSTEYSNPQMKRFEQSEGLVDERFLRPDGRSVPSDLPELGREH